jgi:hypothetical protein
LTFPNDHKNSDLKSFLKSLLCKRSNQRNCSFQKMRGAELFGDFVWDDLIDLKIKSPYIPEAWDLNNNLKNVMNPYEAVIEVIYINLA